MHITTTTSAPLYVEEQQRVQPLFGCGWLFLHEPPARSLFMLQHLLSLSLSPSLPPPSLFLKDV